MNLRIGIDVGGTNTDAVLIRDGEVAYWVKTPTTPEIGEGVFQALRQVLQESATGTDEIGSVMIGTTHFTNAIVERKSLAQVAIVRLGLPATSALPPLIDWPSDLRAATNAQVYLAHGGMEFSGQPLNHMRESELEDIAKELQQKGIRQVAISAVFSSLDPDIERKAAYVIQKVYPEAVITLSSEIGRTGLLERENAALMNAALRELSSDMVSRFSEALKDSGIKAPLYFTQNDGTLMSADVIERYPVLTISSGPTNSMRGAAFLSGLKNAVVIDIGGTTTDIGILQGGFPRSAGVAIEVGQVRTNFRMPDVLSIGVGGGSLVNLDPITVGPKSVGYQLAEKALVFGGKDLTTTDIVVAAGLAKIGDFKHVQHLPHEQVEQVLKHLAQQVTQAVDHMLPGPDPLPVILVGGGSVILDAEYAGLEIVQPEHYQVANAVGASIAQVSGEFEQVYTFAKTSRDVALEQASSQAKQRAIAAGADPSTVEILDIEDIPLAYLPGNATRIRVKAVGDLGQEG